MEYNNSDQNTWTHCIMANDLETFDPAMTGMMETGLGLGSVENKDVDTFLVPAPASPGDGKASPVFTPGMMRFFDGLWTPPLDMPSGTGSYADNDQLGYFGNTTQPSSVSSQAAMSEQESKPQKKERSSQSDSAQERLAAAPPKKKRRERKKKVRTPEEVQRNRETFLERNRKAAQKCRQRRKIRTEGIEHKKNAASELMNILGMEVIHLVEEIKELRAFADAHNSCEHGAFEPPKERSIAPSTSKSTNQRKLYSSPHEASRKGSEAKVYISAEGGSTDAMLGMSPIGQRWKDSSDPCWKLAKEACRRFSEMNPNVIPVLPQLSRYDAYRASRSGSVFSTERYGEQHQNGGLVQDDDHRIDS